jgi:hypothetical protein
MSFDTSSCVISNKLNTILDSQSNVKVYSFTVPYKNNVLILQSDIDVFYYRQSETMRELYALSLNGFTHLHPTCYAMFYLFPDILQLYNALPAGVMILCNFGIDTSTNTIIARLQLYISFMQYDYFEHDNILYNICYELKVLKNILSVANMSVHNKYHIPDNDKTAINLPLKCRKAFFCCSNITKFLYSPYLLKTDCWNYYWQRVNNFDSIINLDDFVNMRNICPVTSMLIESVKLDDNCTIINKTNDFTMNAISFYDRNIHSSDSNCNVFGGVICSKFGSTGKTRYMLNRFIKRCVTSGEKCLIITNICDRLLVEDVIKTGDYENNVSIGWSCSTRSLPINYKSIVIIDWKYISKSKIIKQRLLTTQWDILLMDTIKTIDPKTVIGRYIRFELQYSCLWYVSSCTSFKDVWASMFYFKLDQNLKWFNNCLRNQRFHHLICAYFRNCMYSISHKHNFVKTNANGKRVDFSIQRPVSYPFQQIIVSLRELLNSSTTGYNHQLKMKEFLKIICMMESFVPMIKSDVDEKLLVFSGRKRVGGTMSIVYPLTFSEMEPIDIKVDCVPDCCICICPIEFPTKNQACSHVFCFDCLQEWNRVNSSCPLCKRFFTNCFNQIIFNCGLRRSKRLKLDCSLEKDPKYEQTKYYFLSRFRYLRNMLLEQNLDVEHILIFTHWKSMLPIYKQYIQDIIPDICTIDANITHSNLESVMEKIKEPRVTLTHVNNIQFFRLEKHFQMVILMDTNGDVSFLNKYRHYFTHTKYCYYVAINQSISNVFTNNPTTTNVKSILNKYYKLLTGG